MKITFTELELGERERFGRALEGHEVCFAESLAEVGPDTEALSVFIGSHIDEAFLAGHPGLRLVASRSTSHDHIDLGACACRGVAVCVVPSYGDHVVAEHTFALLLALARRLRETMHLNGKTRFSYEALRCTELQGKTFGILGAGRVGRCTAPIARAFGMKVLAHDLAPEPAEAARLGFEYVGFEELLARSHILSLHLPLTDATFHILDKEAFARCRPGVLVINTARGRLIDTGALLEALESGQVGGAGLDVLGEEAALRRRASSLISDQIIGHLHGGDAAAPPERSKQIGKLMLIDRLLARPDVVFTPHIAFNCVEAIGRIHEATAENLRRFAAGLPLEGLVSPGAAASSRVRPADERCLGANI